MESYRSKKNESKITPIVFFCGDESVSAISSPIIFIISQKFVKSKEKSTKFRCKILSRIFLQCGKTMNSLSCHTV